MDQNGIPMIMLDVRKIIELVCPESPSAQELLLELTKPQEVEEPNDEE